jgi:CP family cyanate transporter-like MFS transporter
MLSTPFIESSQKNQKYRWFILALVTASGTLVVGISSSCMPVLFKEISDDLGLSLVQIGTIWGLGSLAGIFVSIIAGVLSDRLGVKLVLSVFSILVGISGALRGISDNYTTLAVTVFVSGIFRMIIPVTLTKTIGIWFKGEKLGLAMGISAVGMGLGLMLGPLISATILSPALDGWRNVMYFYGAIAVGIGMLWILFGREPYQSDLTIKASDALPFSRAFSKLIRFKALWLIGLALLLRQGCMTGMAGYLPFYLREQGWGVASASGALATYFAVSTICVVPLAYLSDKIGSRKAILFPAALVTMACVALIPVVESNIVWILMVCAGIFSDIFMSVTITMLVETQGLEINQAGTAIGIAFSIANIGIAASPPVGNSLASINKGAPFYFWAFLALLSILPLVLAKETGRRVTNLDTEKGALAKNKF